MMQQIEALDPVLELEAIAQALKLSEDIIKQGGSIDLKGVDEQVALLCTEVVKTEGPVRLKLLPLLENVIESLDRLEANLRLAAQAAAGDDMADKRLRAQNAYGRKPGEGSA